MNDIVEFTKELQDLINEYSGKFSVISMIGVLELTKLELYSQSVEREVYGQH